MSKHVQQLRLSIELESDHPNYAGFQGAWRLLWLMFDQHAGNVCRVEVMQLYKSSHFISLTRQLTEHVQPSRGHSDARIQLLHPPANSKQILPYAAWAWQPIRCLRTAGLANARQLTRHHVWQQHNPSSVAMLFIGL